MIKLVATFFFKIIGCSCENFPFVVGKRWKRFLKFASCNDEYIKPKDYIMQIQTKFLMIMGLAVAMSSCSGRVEVSSRDYTKFVDVKIGTGGHGHVFVGANVPFGMIQLGPTSVPEEWDWCSGYHESDSTVIGFSHTHLSGTGIGDLFDITLMPVVGDVVYARGDSKDPNSGLWSLADRSKEVAEPGYYSVPLERYGVTAELTATSRVGMHRYTFPASDSAAVVIDLLHGGCWDKATEFSVEAENDSTLVGWRHSKGWAADQKVFFVAQFSKAFKLDKPAEGYGRAAFNMTEGEQLLVKVALSPVSVDGAKANMAAELAGWDFEATRAAAKDLWNEELGKVLVDTEDDDAKKVFYTALYHTMIAPSEFCDVNGDYRGSDGEIHTNANFKNYTTFSLWDTYRAAMPLMTILHPEKMADIVNTMLAINDEQGRLPVWHLWGNETDCMVGNPGVIVVADAIVKDVEGIDKERAFAALDNTMMSDIRGGDLRKKYGFIPCDLFNQGNEALAFDMEYAIADGAVANAAKALGKEAEAQKYTERSHSYRNYFDPTVGFMRGHMSDGSWRTPFSPFAAHHREDDYCEGNAWQYTWLVPQDLDGLVACFGDKAKFENKLDSLFIVSSELGEGASPDISGLIGQYAHGNEPSHHILYFYTMIGKPYKTAAKIKEVLSTMYSTKRDGLSGNEDVGQMSGWYILSAMGLYEVEPAGGRYWFGYPLFDRVNVKVGAGKTFDVVKTGKGDYIQSVKLNGKAYDKPYIDHKDVMAGGVLEFTMGDAETVWYE